MQTHRKKVCGTLHRGRPAEDRPRGGRPQRYELRLERCFGRAAILRVFDRHRDAVLLEWSGAVVRHLLQSGMVPAAVVLAGRCDCDKAFVRHLILAGAATRMTLDRIGCLDDRLGAALEGPLRLAPASPPARADGLPAELLPARLERLRVRLADPHKRIAELIFARDGQHLTAADVQCLLLLDCAVISDCAVSRCLDELAERRVIQRIRIDDDNVFYDADTRPHLHVFDPRTRALRNASAHGLVRLGNGVSTARISVTSCASTHPLSVSLS